MFGSIMADQKALSKEARARYKACYCGLCHQLDAQFGSVGSTSLTYDMTFLSMLLGSLYGLTEIENLQHCIRHPVTRQLYVNTDVTEYAADINLFLSYYQCLDDWHDEGSRAVQRKSQQMKEYLPAIRQRWPRQCSAVESTLEKLCVMEHNNELNPDLPTNCFGWMLGEIFDWREDEHSAVLRRMGAALGRFIYLLDAVNDFRSDLKKQRYNPLVSQIDTDFTPILTMMMSECAEEFEKLPLKRDQDILQNVLYSGVWQRYHKRNKEENKR